MGSPANRHHGTDQAEDGRVHADVRMALGASRSRVMTMVLGETMQFVAPGVVLGVCASLLFSNLLTKALFGISPFDPVSTHLGRCRHCNRGRSRNLCPRPPRLEDRSHARLAL